MGSGAGPGEAPARAPGAARRGRAAPADPCLPSGLPWHPLFWNLSRSPTGARYAGRLHLRRMRTVGQDGGARRRRRRARPGRGGHGPTGPTGPAGPAGPGGTGNRLGPLPARECRRQTACPAVTGVGGDGRGHGGRRRGASRPRGAAGGRLSSEVPRPGGSGRFDLHAAGGSGPAGRERRHRGDACRIRGSGLSRPAHIPPARLRSRRVLRRRERRLSRQRLAIRTALPGRDRGAARGRAPGRRPASARLAGDAGGVVARLRL